MTPAERSATLPATQTPGTAVRPKASDSMNSPSPIGCGTDCRPSEVKTSDLATILGATTTDWRATTSAIGHSDAGQVTVDDLERVDPPDDHPDAPCCQLFRLLRREVGCSVQEQHQVGDPLPEHQRLVHRPRTGADHADRPAVQFPAVAVRAVVHIASPQLVHTRDVREFVGQTGGDHQPTGGDRPTVVDGDGEILPRPGGGDGGAVDEAPTVGLDLLAADAGEVRRRYSVSGQEHVDARGGGIARCAGIDDDCAAPRPSEGDRCGETRCTATDHHHIDVRIDLIIVVSAHEITVQFRRPKTQGLLPVWQARSHG